jgi:hypothetical protein
MVHRHFSVIPAKAGTPLDNVLALKSGVPAFAGMSIAMGGGVH